jgi:6-phosphofructokinase 1
MKKVVVLTSGGDSPGMNAAIRAVVRSAHYFGIMPYGSQLGFQGLVDTKLIPLPPESVANCIQHGGTILKADRCLAFYEKTHRDQCRQFLQQEGVDGMVVIGGNGSFRGAALLHQEGGPPVIGIPGTIDNDIPGTDYTIGYDTARNNALEALDRIRDTASSHNRHFLVEVMGRHSGFLAVDVGIAGGAEVILIPEFEPSVDAIATRLTSPKRPKLSSIIIVAEAAQPGRSIQLAKQLEQLTDLTFRVCILGHTQRGGSPSLIDRKIASQMGFMAIKGLLEGISGQMVIMNRELLSFAAFPQVDAPARVLTQMDLLELNEILCT